MANFGCWILLQNGSAICLFNSVACNGIIDHEVEWIYPIVGLISWLDQKKPGLFD